MMLPSSCSLLYIHLTCWKGHTATAQLFLQQGADISAVDKYMNTSLLIACREGRTATTEILVLLTMACTLLYIGNA